MENIPHVLFKWLKVGVFISSTRGYNQAELNHPVTLIRRVTEM